MLEFRILESQIPGFQGTILDSRILKSQLLGFWIPGI